MPQRSAPLLLLMIAFLGIAGCDEAIVGSVDPTPVCTPSELRCTADELAQRCGSKGQWETIDACTFRCMDGACVSECNPGETLCQSGVFRSCTPQGRWSDVLCPTGCTTTGCGTGAPPIVDGGPSAALPEDGSSRDTRWAELAQRRVRVGPLSKRAHRPGAKDYFGISTAQRAYPDAHTHTEAAPAVLLAAARPRLHRGRARKKARRRRKLSGARRLACAATLLLAAERDPLIARADEPGPHRLHVELGTGVVVLDRDARDGFGGHAAIGYEYLVARAFGLAANLDAVLIPYDRTNFPGSGVSGYEALGVGPRLHLAPYARAVDIWLGGAVNGVRTGGLYRVGLSADLGVQIALTPSLALGPVGRYAHVFQPNDDPRGGEDGQLVEISLALRWAAPRREPAPHEEEAPPVEEPVEEPAVEEPVEDPAAEPTPVPTRTPPTRHRPPVVEAPEPPPVPRLRPRIEFASESAQISPEEEPKLMALRHALMNDRGIRHVRIVGHADDLGPADFNQLLSEQRARAVLSWLARHGIRRSRLEAVGVGSSQPRAAGTSETARQENRRVELEVTDYDPDARPPAPRR